jgi:hypothetical protein
LRVHALSTGGVTQPKSPADNRCDQQEMAAHRARLRAIASSYEHLRKRSVAMRASHGLRLSRQSFAAAVWSKWVM